MFSAFLLNLTSIQKSPLNAQRPMRFITVPIEPPWESPYARQPWELHEPFVEIKFCGCFDEVCINERRNERDQHRRSWRRLSSECVASVDIRQHSSVSYTRTSTSHRRDTRQVRHPAPYSLHVLGCKCLSLWQLYRRTFLLAISLFCPQQCVEKLASIGVIFGVRFERRKYR